MNSEKWNSLKAWLNTITRPLLFGFCAAAFIQGTGTSTVAADLDGIIINEAHNPPELFNDLIIETATVNIFGPTLEFSADGPAALYRQFSGRDDVRELCLSADTVIIRSPLWLPQTRVTIYARELRFERDGRIETTPFARSHQPLPILWTDTLTTGRDGDPGHAGGDIDVFVQQFLSDASSSKRFVLRGGDGGPAGDGRDGIDDGQFPFLSDDWNRLMERSGNTICGISDLASIVIYRERSLNNQVTSRCGSQVAAFGESAVRSGVPGPGGRGGILRSTASIGQYADVLGGAPGARGASHVGATLSGSAFVYEFVRTRVVAGREITTIDEVDAPRESGRDAVAPFGVPGATGSFQMTTNGTPRLGFSINRSNATVTVSWPATFTGFTLQHNASLTTTDWVDVRQPFSVSGGTRFITAPMSGGFHFYRLAKHPVASEPVISATFTNGILTLTGDDQDNLLTVSRDAVGNLAAHAGNPVTGSNTLLLIKGGVPTVANTSLIRVFGLQGNDLILVDGVNGLMPRAQLFGGEGDDTLAGSSADDELDGGSGDDNLQGRGGNDQLTGGPGSDTLTGGMGADSLFGGDGDDQFVWNPGDGSDVIEGQGGVDSLIFSGANIGETMELSANGGRLRFFRDVANIILDCHEVESIEVTARGGADIITVNDLSGTGVRRVDLDLAGTPGSGVGDSQADIVAVIGTLGTDTLAVSGSRTAITVTGLAAMVHIVGSEPTLDQLRIDASSGNDSIDASALQGNAIGLTLVGGMGDDTLIGSAGADVLLGGDGDDHLKGGPGIDILDGGAGDNVLIPD